MKIEYIFRQIPGFQHFKLDMILFESSYPVMFTGINDNDELYLFICCLVNSKEAKWIGTKTTYENIIALLENRITIRDSYLNVSNTKLLITYNGHTPTCFYLDFSDIPSELLPTFGEYMDAEEDEFAEELQIIRRRLAYRELKLSPRQNTWMRFEINRSDCVFTYESRRFSSIQTIEDNTFYPVRNIYNSQLSVHS